MNTKFDLIIAGGVVFLSHPKRPYELVEETLDIGISNGKIKDMGQLNTSLAKETFIAKGLHVLPGLIDSQVHFREPGMEHKENIQSGSRAALLGGITAFLEMPNTFPPTTSKTLFEDKINRSTRTSWCDFGFFIGACPENIDDLPKLEQHETCCGIKIFMGSSTGSLLLDKEKDLKQVLKTTKQPIAVHSEDNERLQTRKKLISGDDVSFHPQWRDPQTALIATKKIIHLAQKHQRRVHILHITTAEEMKFLSQYKDVATLEVTPQHLTLSSPECYKNLGTLAQMNPPIRDKKHQQVLWESVRSGLVTMLGSDHAPHLLEEKKKPYPNSPAGMPGTQTMLTLMLDHVHKKKLSLKRLVELLAINPHRYYHIKNQGLIRKGFKANITIVDLKKTDKITSKWLASKCGWSPFEGLTTTGWPIAVLLNGQWAMKENEVLGHPKGTSLSFLKETL